MSNNAHDLTNRLLNALDSNYNVVDMHSVIEIISILEKINITKELLETTRLGKHVNELRRRACEPSLARRAKLLVKRWRDQVIPPANNAQSGQGRSSAEPQVRPPVRLGGTPLTSPALSRVVCSPAVSSPRSISKHGITPPARPVSVASYDSDSQDVIVVEDDDQKHVAVTRGLIQPGSPLNVSDAKKSKRDKKSKKKSKSHSRSGSGTESTTPARDMTFPASPGISPAKPSWVNRNGVAHSPAKAMTPSTLVSPSTTYRTQTSPGVPSFTSIRSSPSLIAVRSPSLTAVRSPSVTAVRSPVQTLTAAQQLAAREGIKIPSTSPAIQMGTRTVLSPALQGFGLKTTSPALTTAAHQLATREGIRLAGVGHHPAGQSSPAPTPQVPPAKRNGCRQKKRKQVEDYGSFIRNKIPQAGVKKVKTTKELLEDLQARKLGLSSATNSPLPSGDDASRDSVLDVAITEVTGPGVAVPSMSPRRREKGRERKGKSKKEDVEKATDTANILKPFEPLQSILARLPPLPLHIIDSMETDDLVCQCPDIDTRSDDCPVRHRMSHPCRPEHVFALHNSYIPCVNGNTAPPLITPKVDLKPLKDPDRPDLYLNVVPKYNYLDYADDKCVKNLSRVPLANDFEWTDLYFDEDPTWSKLKAEPLPDLYRMEANKSENESGNMNEPCELDVRLEDVEEHSRHSNDSRVEVNGNSELVYNSAVVKCKKEDLVDSVKMDVDSVESNFNSDKTVFESNETKFNIDEMDFLSEKVIIDDGKVDFKSEKVVLDCEKTVESGEMDVDRSTNLETCVETSSEVVKVDIDGKMLVELSNNALSIAKLNYEMVNESKVVEFKDIGPDILRLDKATKETKIENISDPGTSGSAGGFGEWHEPIVLGSLLALPYVVID